MRSGRQRIRRAQSPPPPAGAPQALIAHRAPRPSAFLLPAPRRSPLRPSLQPSSPTPHVPSRRPPQSPMPTGPTPSTSPSRPPPPRAPTAQCARLWSSGTGWLLPGFPATRASTPCSSRRRAPPPARKLSPPTRAFIIVYQCAPSCPTLRRQLRWRCGVSWSALRRLFRRRLGTQRESAPTPRRAAGRARRRSWRCAAQRLLPSKARLRPSSGPRPSPLPSGGDGEHTAGAALRCSRLCAE